MRRVRAAAALVTTASALAAAMAVAVGAQGTPAAPDWKAISSEALATLQRYIRIDTSIPPGDGTKAMAVGIRKPSASIRRDSPSSTSQSRRQSYRPVLRSRSCARASVGDTSAADRTTARARGPPTTTNGERECIEQR